MTTTGASGTSPATRGDDPQLDRRLGVASIVYMVVAGAAPLATSVAVVPTVFAASGNPVSPLYFVAAGILLGLFSVGFTLMSRHVQNAGAFYSYIQAGLGKIPGAGAAALALVSYSVLLIGTLAYFGVVASAASKEYLNIDAKWWVCVLLLVVFAGFMAYRDIEVSAKLLAVLLILETLVVLIVDFAIFAQGGHSGIGASPLDVTKMLDGAPGLGLTFAFLGFIGFEATAVFRSEAKNPERTIPRATYIAVALIGFVYAFTAWCLAIGIGPGQALSVISADPGSAVNNVAVEYIGTAMKDVITILIVTSFVAGVLTFVNVVARYIFNLSNGGVLPKVLGEVHPKHLAPSKASVVVTAISFTAIAGLAIGGVDPLTQIYPWFTGVATLGIISLMFLTSAAVVLFHQRNRASHPVWNAVIAPVLSLLGLGFTLYKVIENFDLLVGGQKPANIIFVLAAIVFALGAGSLALARARRPEAYEKMLEN
ncbi:APC family permease [Streptomyces sp. NPDC004610]|uniref:APC family permease n=1 Tax=unclassified Streptomyces TaxID=2593676 RepID=UPI0033ACBC81